MSRYALPALYTLFVWWFSTGAILYLDGLPRATYRWSMLAATVVLFGALAGLAITADATGVSGAYIAFTCAVLVWAWQELGFLTGFVTGSRRTGCPEDARGWRRAGFALQTILHHEIAIIVLAVAVVTLTWGGANQIGTWTFLVLWAMRQSAKLNLFLGVRNRGEAFLPEHLRYLASYFARRSINVLFPFAVAVSIAVAVMLWQRAMAPDVSEATAVGFALVGSLMSLAILEHAFMVVPLPVTALWRWGLGSRIP